MLPSAVDQGDLGIADDYHRQIGSVGPYPDYHSESFGATLPVFLVQSGHISA
jgi:hypothetical protein